MRSTGWIAVIAVAVAAGCAGQDATPAPASPRATAAVSAAACDAACRHYFILHYWAEANAEIAAAPADDRERRRQAKKRELPDQLSQGLAMCTSQCLGAGDTVTTSCIRVAKTVAEAEACVPPATP